MCPDRLIPETEVPKVVIETEAQATNYVSGLVDEMQRFREACAVPYDGNDPQTISAIKRMMWTFLQKQGQVIGALNAFRMTGMITERAFTEFHQQALNSLAPTVTSVN